MTISITIQIIVMLGFFAVVAAILFFLMLTVWICYKIF